MTTNTGRRVAGTSALQYRARGTTTVHSDLACSFSVDDDSRSSSEPAVYTCELRASLRREGAVTVRVAANGVAFGENEITVKLVPQPEVFSLQPSVGPVGGGASEYWGEASWATPLACKFGDIDVRASLRRWRSSCARRRP